jgi:predicted nucleic acid-binding protein
MKILLDTNIVLDLLLERDVFGELAKKIFIKVEKGEIDGYLCPTTITTIYYLLNRHLTKKDCNEAIKSLLNMFFITKIDKKILIESLDNSGVDFEDSVIYTSADFENIDIIITRDKKGFHNSKVKILPPNEFLLYF